MTIYITPNYNNTKIAFLNKKPSIAKHWQGCETTDNLIYCYQQYRLNGHIRMNIGNISCSSCQKLACSTVTPTSC